MQSSWHPPPSWLQCWLICPYPPDPPRWFQWPPICCSGCLWSQSHNSPAAQGVAACQQKAWDAPSVQETYQANLANSADPRSRARLLAAATKEPGACLNALPISAVGLRMDDEVVRVAVGLCLGAALCQPHSYQRCGAQVDSTVTHGLSCSRNEGRHPRHAARFHSHAPLAAKTFKPFLSD